MNTFRITLSCLCSGLILAPRARADLPVVWSTQFAPGSAVEPKGLALMSNGVTFISSKIGLYVTDSTGYISLLNPAALGPSIPPTYNHTLFNANGPTVGRYNTKGSLLSTISFPTTLSPLTSSIAAYADTAFVVGEATGQAEPNSFITKFSNYSSGDWQTSFGSTGLNAATSVTTGSLGSSLVAGWTRGTLPGQTNHGNADPYVIKFSSFGAPLWRTQLGGVNNEYAFDLAYAGTGDTYVTGRISYTDGNTIGANTSDAFLTKLDSNGVPLWTTTFDRSGADQSGAIALDKAGNIWIGGSSESLTDAGPAASITNPFLAEYSPTGTLLGTRIFHTAVGGTIDDLQASNSGGVIAVGYTQGLTTQYSSGFGDPFVARIVPEPGVCGLLIGAIGVLGMGRSRGRRD